MPKSKRESRPITERFADFHDKNPEVYRLFRLYALQLWNAGHRRGGAKMIWERLRWEFLKKQADGREAYRLPNDLTAYYARELAKNDERFKEFFEFRATPLLERAHAREAAEEHLHTEGLGL